MEAPCAVCLDTPTDPVKLDCAHVLCRACLRTLEDRSQNGTLSQRCPTCRSPLPRVAAAYRQAWGLQDDAALATSFDGCCAWRPGQVTRSGWLHVDQDALRGNQREMLQGLVHLTAPVSESTGGLVHVDGSHRAVLVLKYHRWRCDASSPSRSSPRSIAPRSPARSPSPISPKRELLTIPAHPTPIGNHMPSLALAPWRRPSPAPWPHPGKARSQDCRGTDMFFVLKFSYHSNNILCAENPGPKLSIKPLSPFCLSSSINLSKTYKTVALEILPYNFKISFVVSKFLSNDLNKSSIV